MKLPANIHPRILAYIFIIFLLSGCQVQGQLPSPGDAWQPQDLRLLEGPGAGDPSFDLIAAYARQTAFDLELRFDLLGPGKSSAYDLYVLIDSQPGGGGRLPLDLPAEIAWDLAVHLPARGLPRAFDASGNPLPGLRPRILRSSVLDSATVRLSRASLPAEMAHPLSFQAFVVVPGLVAAFDVIGPALLHAPHPDIRADAYLAFWDTLPSSTPAIALRRWNGAHTGPYGQRHGLQVLLENSRAAGIPVVMLDLMQPQRLAVLDVLGGLELVRGMVADNLLILPGSAWGDPQTAAEALASSRAAGQRFKLSRQAAWFGSVTSAPGGEYEFAFYQPKKVGPSPVLLWNNQRLVPLPTTVSDFSEYALPVELRRALLNAAISPGGGLVALGGSLPASPFGDSSAGRLAFDYLAGHPWIHMLDREELVAFPTTPGLPACPDLLCLATLPPHPRLDEIRASLTTAPVGLFSALAWQTYWDLTASTPDPRQNAVRSGYLGTVGALIAAARWENDPQPQADCPIDLDYDGMPECILASETVFAVLDAQGARLVLLAARKGEQVVQVVGPRAQLALGLGDPTGWQPERGLSGGDPQDIPGAFADPADPWLLHAPELQPGEIRFFHPQSSANVIYRLDSTGIEIEIERADPLSTAIPLIMIDNRSAAPGGFARYLAAESPNTQTWRWGIDRSAQVEIIAQGAQITGEAFSGSLPYLLQPEDPNFSYPAGRFLPFTFAQVLVDAPGSFSIKISANIW